MSAREFEAHVQAFTDKVDDRLRRVVNECAMEIHRSVVEGSEITGAPGQPVDTGFLKSSWIARFLEAWRWQTTSFASYAKHIEEAVGITLRSKVGGFHSVALTRGGWQRIVDTVARRVRGT